MKRKLYLSLVLLSITLAGYGQGSQINSTVRTYSGGYYGPYNQLTFNAGYIITPRNSPSTSTVYFTAASSWQTASDGSYIDGYAETQGKTAFTFPIGRVVTTDGSGNPSPAGNGSLRTAGFSAPTATATDRLQGAYWQTNPTNATLPSGAMPSANVGTGVQTVSTVEYWDINGAVPATLTLTWDATSALTTLTGNTLSNLIVVGYNPSTSKWENLGAAAVSGTLSGTGTISTSVAAFNPDNYTAYTFGSLQVTSTPVASVGNQPTSPGTSTGSVSLTGTSGAYPINTPVSVTYTTPSGTTAVFTGTTDGSGTITIPNLPAGTYGPFVVSVNGGTPSSPSNTVTLTDPAPVASGYIYLHKNATDEDSSPDFNFTVTGPNSFNNNYSLNDQHPYNYVWDVGATGDGGLYAIAETSGPRNIYYRALGSSVWTQLAGLTANRIDGGPGNTNIYTNGSGQPVYYDGTTATVLGGSNAADVAFDRSGTNRVFYVNGSGQLFYRNATSGSWTQAAGTAKQRIDVAPNGMIVSSSGTGYNNVYISNFDGTNAVDLGSPAGGNVGDVAVGEDGVIYALTNTTAYRYSGGYAAGGTWTAEPTSRNSTSITGGRAGQIWASAGSGNLGNSLNNIWSRTANGIWIDDEVVRTAGGNSVLIPVTPGTYSVNETVTSGWDLGSVDIYDPTNNSSADVTTAITSVNVAAGEVVHLTYRNFSVSSTFPVVNTCTGTPYLETFGTGSNTTLGSPLTGQTNYHYIGTANRFLNDGYYMVASNSSQAAIGGSSFGSFNDHTTGNGTGRMMLVNASFDKGQFFRRRFTGLLTGTAYSFSAWIMNLNDAPIKPNVQFQIIDPTTQTVLATLSTGNITSVGQWTQYQLQFTASQSDVDLVLSNNNIGGNGNDLALDDISFGLARPNQPVLSVTNPTCSTPGSLTVNSPTGVSLEYSLDGTNYQSSPIFSPVTPGSYSVTARYTNSVGCVSTPATVTATLSICGTIWNDADGSLSQNNSEPGTNAGGPLYVNLVDATGTVVASTTVAPDGTYSLTGIPANTSGVKLVLTNTASNTAPALPTGWVNTGEPAGVGNGATQSATPGVIELTIGTTPLTNQNFGIEQLPTPGSGTATVANSGGTSPVTVPPSAFTSTSPSTDTAPGSVTAIRITSFPSNVTSLTIDGTTYTAGNFPSGGVVVPTDGSGAPSVPILIDPTNDGSPASFTFTAIDNAGKESTTTGTAVINFTLVPDLTPIIYALPTVVNGTQPITVVVDVVELLGTATSGTIRVYVSKDARTSLSFSASDASVGGRSVSNSVWSFDGSSNSSYYILTTSQVITGGSKLSFGLSGSLTPGATKGQLTISTVILGGSGGEVKVTNNVDADKIDYFIQ